MLTDYNNLRQFMETKNLSSKQIRWAQKLSCYYFQINYYLDKANRAANALSQYFQQSAKKEKTLQVKNVKIFHCLQLLLTRVSGLLISHFFPLHQILICGTTILLRLNKFEDML